MRDTINTGACNAFAVQPDLAQLVSFGYYQSDPDGNAGKCIDQENVYYNYCKDDNGYGQWKQINAKRAHAGAHTQNNWFQCWHTSTRK